MKEKFFEKLNIREPRKPSKPKTRTTGQTGKTSLEEGIKFVAGALKKDPEIKREPIIQGAEYAGSFHFLNKIQNGDSVKEGCVIGYLKGFGVEGEIRALADGIISGLPEQGAQVKENGELFTITPTSEK